MKKDSYYFPHDSDSAHDPKIMAIRVKYGWAGYAWFFRMIEHLRNDPMFMFPLEKYQLMALAKEFEIDIETLMQFLDLCFEVGLFVKKNGFLFSRSLNQRMEVYLLRNQQQRLKALKRWHGKNPKMFKEMSKKLLPCIGGNATAMPRQCRSMPLKESKREDNKRKNPPTGFLEFWESYPKRHSKKDALKAFSKINPSEQEFKKIMGGLESWKKTEEWSKENGKYIPLPASWLNKERWEDELELPETHKRDKRLRGD